MLENGHEYKITKDFSLLSYSHIHKIITLEIYTTLVHVYLSIGIQFFKKYSHLEVCAVVCSVRFELKGKVEGVINKGTPYQ